VGGVGKRLPSLPPPTTPLTIFVRRSRKSLQREKAKMLRIRHTLTKKEPCQEQASCHADVIPLPLYHVSRSGILLTRKTKFPPKNDDCIKNV
jgi:hypothetical protein